MAETSRTATDLLTNLFQNGQSGGISAQDLRDFIESMRMPHASASIQNNSTETVINTIDAVEIIAGTFTGAADKDFTVSATGRLTYTGTPDRHFHIVSNFDVTTAANNQTVEFCWVKNGTTQLPVPITQRVGTGSDVRTLSVHSDVTMSTGDYIELKAANKTSTANLTVSNAYLFAVGMFI